MTDVATEPQVAEHRASAWVIAWMVLAFGAGALGAGGCGDTDRRDARGGANPRSVAIEVDDNLFEPQAVQITVGDTVRWEWVGQEPHNVKSVEFESDVQQEGLFQHTFGTVGRADYVCVIHPGMSGTVDVAAG